MTTYYFTLKSTQFKSFFISIIVSNLNKIEEIFLNDDRSLNIFIESLENSITFDSSNTYITNLICSFSNVTDFPVSIFTTISINHNYLNPLLDIISIYKINLIDFIECKNVIILNSKGTPRIEDAKTTYIKNSDIIDFGSAELINTFVPKNIYNLTNKNYVDSLISSEKSLILSLINYNKIIQPSSSILNINGFPIGVFPLFMPDNIISTGYDGWYFSNSSGAISFIPSTGTTTTGFATGTTTTGSTTTTGFATGTTTTGSTTTTGFATGTTTTGSTTGTTTTFSTPVSISIPSSRFVNWSFYSSINNILFSDLNSLYFNIYINSNNTNIPSIMVFTKPINGSLYYSCSLYSISNQNLQILTPGYYTCYALDIPPITPNHIQIQLNLISSIIGPGETILSNPSNNILNISIYSNNILNYDFILNQVTISSKFGNENMILSNDSLYSNDTRARLNRIFQFFFDSDSSLIPVSGRP